MDGKDLPQPQIEQQFPNPEASPNKLGVTFLQSFEWFGRQF